jgi:hypothetical protein
MQSRSPSRSCLLFLPLVASKKRFKTNLSELVKKAQKGETVIIITSGRVRLP